MTIQELREYLQSSTNEDERVANAYNKGISDALLKLGSSIRYEYNDLDDLVACIDENVILKLKVTI